MNVSTLLLATCCTVAQAQLPYIELNVEPTSVSVGQSAVLTRNIKNAEHVFISQLGKVSTAGQETIRPAETTNYVLVAEGPGGVASRVVALEVTGTKGDDEFPDQSKFRYPFSHKIKARSFPQLLDHIHTVLQDTMRYSLRMTKEPTGVLLFITNWRDNGALVTVKEKRIGRRRLAYMVEVSDCVSKANAFSYTIKSLIEYQRKIERIWRLEENTSLYVGQSREFAEKLGSKI